MPESIMNVLPQHHRINGLSYNLLASPNAALVWHCVGNQDPETEFLAQHIARATGLAQGSVTPMLNRLLQPKEPLIEVTKKTPKGYPNPYRRLESGLWIPLLNLCDVILEHDQMLL